MGVTDEHWCSRCKRSLDKKVEEYLEMTAINDPEVLGIPVAVKPGEKAELTEPKVERFHQGLLCESCARKLKVVVPDKDGKTHRRSFWAFFKDLRKRGNPTFRPVLACLSYAECETFEAPGSGTEYVWPYARPCAHCAVDLKGRLYCKRRHPGGMEVVMEQSVVDQQKREMVVDFLFTFLRENPAVAKLSAQTNKESTEAMLKALGLDPKLTHVPDPVRTGADIGGIQGDYIDTDDSSLHLAVNPRCAWLKANNSTTATGSCRYICGHEAMKPPLSYCNRARCPVPQIRENDECWPNEV